MSGNDNNNEKKTSPHVADCAVHGEKIRQLEASDKTQWEHINKWNDTIRKYVPVWVTIVLMAMSGITGAALTFAGMMIKFAGK